MVTKFKSFALAGVLAFAPAFVAPAFAQDAGVPIVNQLPIVGDLPIVGNGAMTGGVDLDPMHIFTPAAEPAPAAAPMKMKSHRHMMMHHKKMMMHHKKMMMHHKMMMKK